MISYLSQVKNASLSIISGTAKTLNKHKILLIVAFAGYKIVSRFSKQIKPIYDKALSYIKNSPLGEKGSRTISYVKNSPPVEKGKRALSYASGRLGSAKEKCKETLTSVKTPLLNAKDKFEEGCISAGMEVITMVANFNCKDKEGKKIESNNKNSENIPAELNNQEGENIPLEFTDKSGENIPVELTNNGNENTSV